MEQVQLIQISAEQLKNAIVEGVNEQLVRLEQTFQPKEPEELLTRNEVKDLLKVDLSTVHNWTKKGILTSYGIGNRVYYKRSEIEAILTPIRA